MTVRVLKSQIPENFAEQVELYRHQLLTHRFTTGVPAPRAESELAESCVFRMPQGKDKPDDYVADYVIVDDTPPPPPPPTLTQRKNKLRNDVGMAEQAAIDEIITPGKRRLLAIQAAQAQSVENPTADQTAIIQNMASINRRILAIQLQGAEMQAAIDDLDDASIDSWAMTPFV